MKIYKTPIAGLLIIEPQIFRDSRGYFTESFSQRDFEQQTGLSVRFVQDNESLSSYGVVRGMHFQKPPYAQAKLVRCVAGKVLDVALDLRTGSQTFGKHFAVELSSENHLQLFIPEGFAHGFSVLSQTALFQYKCNKYYHPESEGGILLDDSGLGIDWKVQEESRVLSEKDMRYPAFKDFENPF